MAESSVWDAAFDLVCCSLEPEPHSAVLRCLVPFMMLLMMHQPHLHRPWRLNRCNPPMSLLLFSAWFVLPRSATSPSHSSRGSVTISLMHMHVHPPRSLCAILSRPWCPLLRLVHLKRGTLCVKQQREVLCVSRIQTCPCAWLHGGAHLLAVSSLLSSSALCDPPSLSLPVAAPP